VIGAIYIMKDYDITEERANEIKKELAIRKSKNKI